jgi:hypothetical protein
MRVNVYDHELTSRVERVEQTAPNTDKKFIGIRFYIGPTIMHEENDDDSAAVTFWVPAVTDDAAQYKLFNVLTEAVELASSVLAKSYP